MSNTKNAHEYDRRFQNKTLVITGAAGQFGRAGGLYFALRGANLVLLDQNQEALLDTLTFIQRQVNSEKNVMRERAREQREVQLRLLNEKMSENKAKSVQCSSTDAFLDTMASTMNFVGSELRDTVKKSKLLMEAGIERSTACVEDTALSLRDVRCAPMTMMKGEEDYLDDAFWKDHPGALWKNKEFILALQCDVTDQLSVKECMETAKTKFGSIDLVWNNAGYQGQIRPTLEYDPNDFQKVMEINVTGMFIVLQAAAKHMAAQSKSIQSKTGRTGKYSIVNTASVAGLRGRQIFLELFPLIIFVNIGILI